MSTIAYRRNGYIEIPAYCTGPYMEAWYGKRLEPRWRDRPAANE